MGERRMEPKDDMLFRISCSYKGKIWTYIGPYTDVGVARRAVTRERNRMKGYSNPEDYVFEIEACLPDWKVVEK